MYYPKFDHMLLFKWITRTVKGNRKMFKSSGVRLIGSSKQIAGIKGKTSFYCTVNILITFNCSNGR